MPARIKQHKKIQTGRHFKQTPTHFYASMEDRMKRVVAWALLVLLIIILTSTTVSASEEVVSATATDVRVSGSISVAESHQRASWITIINVIISALTFGYLLLSTLRSSITSTITSQRIAWINQARESLLRFEKCYRKADYRGMYDARATLESLMPRDTPSYCIVLKQINTCIEDGYTKYNHEKLIGLSAYILARAWQRAKLDSTMLGVLPDKWLNKIVTKKLSKLKQYATSGKYLSQYEYGEEKIE